MGGGMLIQYFRGAVKSISYSNKDGKYDNRPAHKIGRIKTQIRLHFGCKWFILLQWNTIIETQKKKKTQTTLWLNIK